MAKASYTKPSSEVWAEEVASGKYDAEHSRVNRGDDAGLSDDGFIAVSPEYRNFADPIHKPYQGEGKVGTELEAQFLEDDADNDKGATDEGESSDDEADKPAPRRQPAPPSS